MSTANQPTELPGFRNIAISGRIAAGSTSLANKLSEVLSWKHIEGGDVFWEVVRKKMGLAPKDTKLRPDKEDEDFDASLKKLLKEDEHIILETKLAAFNAQGIEGVYKILVICEDGNGQDQTQIRIDRLINRETQSVEEAKEEILVREKSDLEKWQKLYANGDANWTYWDPKYYDLIVNTYSLNKEEALQFVLEKIGVSSV
jgi:cytidylate kinase